MKLLYPHEHLSCFNYEKGNRPVFETLDLKTKQMWKIFSVDNLVIFVLKGDLDFSFGQYLNKNLSEGKMMVLPAGSHLSCRAKEDAHVVVIRLLETKQLCDCYSLDMLLKEGDNISALPDKLYYLDINERIRTFLTLTENCVNDGLKCVFYLDLKAKELFFMLRAYYTKEDLLRFFHLLLSRDVSFSDLVLKNHHKVKNVQELADMLHYSLSGFQKRFKKVFGVSVYHWMKEQRSRSIFHEINNTQKSFKEIGNGYGFSSPSHFNDFCKANFGAPPGKIRQSKALLNTEL